MAAASFDPRIVAPPTLRFLRACLAPFQREQALTDEGLVDKLRRLNQRSD